MGCPHFSQKQMCVCVCVCSPDREVGLTEMVTFQIKVKRSKAYVNAI